MTTDEDKISRLYQQAKDQTGKDHGPPAHLDNAILKAAHEAVEHVSPVDELSIVKGPFSGGWRATASIAAVLIITVILVPLIEQDEQVPEFNDRVNGLQPTQVFKDEIDELEVKSLRKEKAKKRVTQDAAKVQAEQQMQLNHFQTFSESDSFEEAVEDRENIASVRSASPAPSSVATSAATVSSGLQQQEVKAQVTSQKKQLLQANVESSQDTMLVEELSPKQWLENIRQLIEKGELETAEKELDAFKLRYPDEKIDSEILESIKPQP